MCTIQPNNCGTNLPPAASHASGVLMLPPGPNRVQSEVLGCSLGRQMFTCACQRATLSGTRSFSLSSAQRAGAVYIAPVSFQPSAVRWYNNEVGFSGSNEKAAWKPYL